MAENISIVCDDEYYYQLKDEYHSAAEKKKIEFLNEDLQQNEKAGWLEYFKKITEYYVTLALFPSPEVQKKFNELGVNNFWLKWLTPIEQFESELQKIQQNNQVLVLWSPLLIYTHKHLIFKILHELTEWQNMITVHNNMEISMVKKLFVDDYRNRSYGNGIPKTFESHRAYLRNQKISEFEKKLGDKKNVKEDLLEISSGNTLNVCLRPMIKYIINKGLNRADYCVLVYDFFRLIMKDDDTFYDYDQFLIKAPKSYKTFRKYQVEKIYKTLIRERTKK